MAALDFPSSPTVGQSYTVGSLTWVWDGTTWNAQPPGTPFGGGSDQAFWCNSTTITTNYSIPSGYNAGTFGPVTINAGVTVTVPAGSVWTIV